MTMPSGKPLRDPLRERLASLTDDELSAELHATYLKLVEDINSDRFGAGGQPSPVVFSQETLRAAVAKLQAWQRPAAERIADFEADITGLMLSHMLDRADAIEKDIANHGLTLDVAHYGMEYYANVRNLPYGYFDAELVH